MTRSSGIACGVDGCPEGWAVVTKDIAHNSLSWRVCRTLAEIANSQPVPWIIAIDIPIGLPDAGPRACDLEARRLLGPVRASSVFPAPVRVVLGAPTYADACQRRLAVDGKKMSCQAWGIVPKIRDVDTALRNNAALRERVYEVHPEVSFYAMAHERPMQYRKKDNSGRQERSGLIREEFGSWLDDALLKRSGEMPGAKENDVLDAFAALWTALRIARGTARSIPATPLTDAFGLRMAITY